MPCDYSKYPPNWKKEIRPTVLERANHECEFCGAPNKATVYRVQKSRVWFSLDEVDSTHSRIRKYYESTGRVLEAVKVVLTIAHLDHDPETTA